MAAATISEGLHTKRLAITVGLVITGALGCADAMEPAERSGEELNPHVVADTAVEVRSETRDLDPEEFQCLVGDAVCRFGTRYHCERTGDEMTFVRTDFGCGDVFVQEVLGSDLDLEAFEQLERVEPGRHEGKLPSPGDRHESGHTTSDSGGAGGHASTDEDRSSNQNGGTGSQTQPSPGL